MSKFLCLNFLIFSLIVAARAQNAPSVNFPNNSTAPNGDSLIAGSDESKSVDDLPKIEKINAATLSINGATDAIFSASGKFTAIQSESKFFLLSTDNLGESIAALPKAIARDGKIIGFLPSDALVYTAANGIFLLEPTASKPKKLFSGATAQLLDTKGLTDKSVVLSNELIVSGDGNYDWEGKRGNILKFDLRRRRFSRGAQIDAFWYASASPDGRYVLYEHGAEDTNKADVYDILKDKNHPVSSYFNFKKEFPKYEETDETPIAWIGAGKFLASVSGGGADDGWLVLLDVPGRKILWKTVADRWFFPTSFHQLSANQALVNYNDGEVYELSLSDGKMIKSPKIGGSAVAVSPDKKRVAFVADNQLFVAAPDGADKRSVFEMPAGWEFQKTYKAMGERSPRWSPRGDSLMLFGEKEILFVEIR